MEKEVSGYVCPVCGKKRMKIILVESEVPYFGKILISSSKCESCGFKFNDVFSVESKEPLEYRIRVTEEEDLMVRVIKSSSATVIIPELGLKIEPGPLSQGYVSNVEGVLRKVEEVFKGQYNVLKGKKKEKMKGLIEKLERMIEGLEEFSLIIKDPLGNSAIVSKKARKRKLRKSEIKKLKMGYLMFEKK